jgi:biopolymer transport protein ExbB
MDVQQQATSVINYIVEMWNSATQIWLDGGWAMIAIAVNAFVIFAVGVNIHMKLRRKGFLSLPESTWRRWIDNPSERKGPIGEMLDTITGSTSLSELTMSFDDLAATEIKPFSRDLVLMRVCVSAAPLLGLLGTVTGMLSTFWALSSGSGGDKTMQMVAEGISEALITTETGLVIALPGLFFQYQLARKHERYKAFLAHLQTVCTQKLYRRMQQEGSRAA